MKYIDVSEHQGVIDWDKAKPNVSGVILRAGYGQNNIDKCFVRNVSECNRLGIPCGAYWFSYALDYTMAAQEAAYLIAAVKPYKMELPLAFDFEYSSADYCAKRGVAVTMQKVSDMARAFCEAIEKAGYYVLNYSNPDYLDRYFDDDVEKRFGTWLASWPVAKVFDKSKPPRGCQIWQWGTSIVPGISGAVDTNESYHDFKTIIANAGLNNLKPAPIDPKSDAMKWAKECRIVDESMEGVEDFALMLWRYNAMKSNEDYQYGSGALSD